MQKNISLAINWKGKRWDQNQQIAEHSYHVFRSTIQDLQRLGFDDLKGKMVLDLGCGTRYHFGLQCAALGASVTALDMVYFKPSFLPLAFFQKARHDGFKLAVRTVLRRLFLDKPFYEVLEARIGKSLSPYHSKINCVVVDSDNPYPYPLMDESFDLIVSQAVLEHVEDINVFAREVDRLLIPGGYFYAMIHNFYSISGGHRPEWSNPDEQPARIVPPWDHLRENQFPSHQYLNRLKPDDYLGAFAGNLEVLLFEGRGRDYSKNAIEGERFLTSELEHNLSAYPRDLLLTRAWCLIVRKRK